MFKTIEKKQTKGGYSLHMDNDPEFQTPGSMPPAGPGDTPNPPKPQESEPKVHKPGAPQIPDLKGSGKSNKEIKKN